MDTQAIYDALIRYGIQLLLAILVLLIGLKIIGIITRVISNRLIKAEMDPSIRPFITSLLKVALQLLLVISVASMIGIEMTVFIAVIGAMAFAVGLALQGSLANFAGGVLILLLKPFKAGDYIQAAGHAGTVKEIQIFYTLLDTPDNERVVVPNAFLSNSSAINYSKNPTRRLNLAFGVGYEADIDQVRSTLLDLAQNHPRIFDDPPPQVLLGEHGDSAVVFYLRMWCDSDNYWPLYFEFLETVKKAFDQAGINIPYPQRELHLIGPADKYKQGDKDKNDS